MEKYYKIDSEIYRQDILEKAILDFSEVAEISFNGEELKISGNSLEEIEEVFNEFGNYYIGLLNQ